MAFVPELDDPSKDASASPDDTNDISSQAATTNLAAAPSTGGQSAAGGGVSAPVKSSGSFQDFSKFKTANQGKLTALSNLATDQAKAGVDKAKSAFDTAGSAFQSEIQKNAKNFGTSQFAKLDKESNLDAGALGKDLDEAGKLVDSGVQQGQLAGSQEYNALQNKTNQVQGLGTRAGTAAVLGDYNTANGNRASAAAANQDSLLLQSMGDYRTKANQVAQSVKGTDTNALAAQKTNLANAADLVNTQNKQYKDQALNKLQSVRSDIDTDLDTRAQQADQARIAGVNTQAEQAKTGALTKIKDSVAQQVQAARSEVAPDINHPPSGTPTTLAGQWTPGAYQTAMNAYQARQAEANRLAAMDENGLLGEFGQADTFNNTLNQFKLDGSGQKITADNIYRDDTKRQAQVNALNTLLKGGKQYNAGALDPMNSQALSGIDQLVSMITGGAGDRIKNAQYKTVAENDAQNGDSREEVKDLITKNLNPLDAGSKESLILGGLQDATNAAIQRNTGVDPSFNGRVSANPTDSVAATAKAAEDTKKALQNISLDKLLKTGFGSHATGGSGAGTTNTVFKKSTSTNK